MTRIMQMNQNAVILSAVKQMSRSKQRNKDSKRYMNLTDIIADILIAVFDVEMGIVGSNDTTDKFDAERQTHCAAPQPVYNTGKLHSRSIVALISFSAADDDCSTEDIDCRWR